MNSTRDGLARDHRVQLVHTEPRSLRKLYSRVRNCNTSRNRKQNKKVNAKLRILPAVIGVLLHEDTDASQRAALGILLLQCWSCRHVSDRQNPRRCFFLTNAKANSHKLQRSHLASWLCMWWAAGGQGIRCRCRRRAFISVQMPRLLFSRKNLERTSCYTNGVRTKKNTKTS